MTDRPLVSVITGCIPDRIDLLLEAMRNIRESTYPNLEHCIAFEGEPGDVDRAAETVRIAATSMARQIPTHVVALGRWWSRFLRDSYGAAPLIVGQLVARGEYQCWLADDERMTPDHIISLVDLCETEGADFAYSQVEMWLRDQPSTRWIIGKDRPEFGQMTHCLYRASLFDRAGGVRIHVGRNSDWDQYERFMQAGRWAFLPRVTFSHRADA